MRTAIDRVGHGIAQAVGVVESQAAGIPCELLHGKLVLGPSGVLLGDWRPLRILRVVGSISRETRRRHRIDGYPARREQIGGLPNLSLVLAWATRAGKNADGERTGEPDHILAAGHAGKIAREL